MGRFIICLGLLASLCVGCNRYYRDTSIYQKSGREKAIVTVLPVIDHTNANLCWDLSTEFTEEIQNKIVDSKKMYLLRGNGTKKLAEALNTPNPSSIPLEATQKFGAAEFVVVAELVEQSEISYDVNMESTDEMNSLFNIALRLRVIDVRYDKPKVILQEMMNKEHAVARAFLNIDYAQNPWGSEAFERTPIGLAHHRLVHQIVGRIESYIEANR